MPGQPDAQHPSPPQGQQQRTVLVTGGAGFFGGVLKQRLLDEGFHCVSLDLHTDGTSLPRLDNVRGDIRDEALLNRLFSEHRFEAVFHCAAILAHAVSDEDFLWTSNVDGTEALVRQCADHGVGKLVFTSSNCLWGESLHRPVREDDVPAPVEIYGRSKWQAEKVLARYRDRVDSVVLRCPTIIDSGRLGLLAILFDFIREGRKVWVVGDGGNRYQFVYAPDVADACLLALGRRGSAVYNVGSDQVRSLREIYEYVISQAGTGARVASLPKAPTLAAMRLASALKISPLGPYHWRMISEDFEFDTSKAKEELGWQPSVTNEQMLAEAYKSYERDYDEIHARTDVSAHRQPAKMGAIRVLKWLS
jgi:UDP-glucose 4-epimerase